MGQARSEHRVRGHSLLSRRNVVRVTPGLVLACLLMLLGPGALVGCADLSTSAERAVRDARPGKIFVPPGQGVEGVALVYSYRSDINLKYGFEKTHPFDLHKARKVFDQLVEDRAIKPENVFVPAPADDDLLYRVHDKEYIRSLDSRQVVARIMDSNIATWQSKRHHVERIVGAYRAVVGGTVLAAELAARHGVAVHLGGGLKHALFDRGARSCLLADIPIAMDVLREQRLADRIMIIDLGALQANGIAVCVAGQDNTALFDIYERNNYPLAKQPETVRIPIENGLTDGQYDALLSHALPKALDEFHPEFVFYIGGVDTVAGDPVGRTRLTAAGLVKRDLFVADEVRKKRRIPLCMVLGGGWGSGSWRLHYRSVRAMLTLFGGVDFRGPAIGS